MAKNTGKVREKSGNFVSPEKWESWLIHKSCLMYEEQFWAKVPLDIDLSKWLFTGV